MIHAVKTKRKSENSLNNTKLWSVFYRFVIFFFHEVYAILRYTRFPFVEEP